MSSVLLHICCAVCALDTVNQLQQEGYQVTGFFYNPNIHPRLEYRRRKQALLDIQDKLDIQLLPEDYQPQAWFQVCGDYAQEGEGGARCLRCFKLRLQQTKAVACKYNFDYFTTTLTISPHKNNKVINDIGTTLDARRFLVRDFKKKGGFEKTIKAAKELGIYRQHYCGCTYSRR
jgi:predicted adenine nucleotide alpha hydrolase (AANH) superfamily ATPase